VRLGVDQDLEDGLGSVLVDIAVGDGESSQHTVDGQAVSQSDHTCRPKLVVVQLEDFDLWVHLGV